MKLWSRCVVRARPGFVGCRGPALVGVTRLAMSRRDWGRARRPIRAARSLAGGRRSAAGGAGGSGAAGAAGGEDHTAGSDAVRVGCDDQAHQLPHAQRGHELDMASRPSPCPPLNTLTSSFRLPTPSGMVEARTRAKVVAKYPQSSHTEHGSK